MATLREAKGLLLTPTTDAEDLYSPQNLAVDQAAQIAGSSQMGRGWESAGLSGRAGDLWTDSLKARIDGDPQTAAVLASQAQDLQQQASAWAPTVQNFSDIKGLRSGIDWAGGALGNLRTSVAPALGGLAGAAAGTALAPLTGGVINPVTAGFAGASLAGYNAGTNESVAQAMNDPDIVAARTPQEILNVGRLKGFGESVLEAIVPTILGGKLVGQGVKNAVGAGFGNAAARIGKGAAVGGATEFATEGAQSLAGQTAQNYLAGRDLTNYDYLQAANEGMAGLVGGGVMGGVGGVADVAYDRLGKGVARAQEIKADPAQFVADKAIDLSRMTGTVVGKAEPVVKNVFDWMTDSKRRTYDDLTNPNIPDANVDAYAHEWATHVLSTQKEHPQADVQAAAEYIRDIAKPGALSTYRLKIEANRNENRQTKDYSSIAEEINKRTWQTKSSKMRGTLVDNFGDQEGRDPLDDVLMDDFGNQVSGAMAKHGYENRKFGDINFQVPATAPTGPEVSYGGELARRGQPQWPTLQDSPTKTPSELQAKYEATRKSEKVGTEQTADIWRKQGVSEKLLSATTDQTDPAQREMAIALMGWVERGFKDTDGNVFVPESLVKKHGKNAGAVIKSVVEAAFNNGLIGHDVAKQIPDVVEMAQKEYLDSKSVLDTVAGAIPEYARKKYTASDIDNYLIPMLRHVAKHGLSSDKAEAGRQEAALLDIFGTKEALAQAMSKFPTPTGRNMLAQANDEEDVFDANERGVRRVSQTSDDEADAKYESDLEARGPRAAKTIGRGAKNEPFNLNDPIQRESLTKLLSDPTKGRDKTIVGMWQNLKDLYGPGGKFIFEQGDPAVAAQILEAAEYDLLSAHASNYLNDAEHTMSLRNGVPIEAIVDKMSNERRKVILGKIDKQLKLVRIDSVDDSQAPDAIPKGRTTDLREGTSQDPNKDGLTVDKGGLFLERESNGRANVRPFPTSAMRLIKHFQKSKEYAEISGEGVQGSYQMVLKSLGALMETEVAHAEAVQEWYDEVSGPNSDASPEVVAKAKAAVEKAQKDGRFTGRIGYKTDLAQPVIWLPRGLGVDKATNTRASHEAIGAQLPKVLQLGLRGTVADMHRVARGALASGERKGELVPLETNFLGQKRALTELAARPETSDGFRWVIENTLSRTDDEGNQKPLGPWKRGIAEFYQKLRSWDGTGDEYFSSVSDKTAPKRGSRVDSERAIKSLRLINRLIEEATGVKAPAADQTVVSTAAGTTPEARKRKIPLAIQEKIANHRKAGRIEQADKLYSDWTKTFRDVAAWQIANSKDRGSDDNSISVGDLTSDESALSMTRAEDPSMEGKERSTTPFIPTYPLAYRKLLEMKDAAGSLTEDETAALAELRRGAPAWHASFNKLLETNPAKLSEDEQKLVAWLRQGTAAWRAKYGTDSRMPGTIERNDEGMATGLSDDAVGAGFGGGTSTNKGTKPVAWRAKGDKLLDQRTGTTLDSAANEPVGAPLATAETPDRFTTKIDPVLEARDWAFTKLRKGVPAFAESVKSLEKLPKKERIEKLKLMQKGLDALLTMSPAEIVSEMDRALTEGHGSVILARGKTAATILRTLLSEGIRDGKDAAVVGYGGRAQRVPEQRAGRVAPAGKGPTVPQGPERGTKSEDRSPGGSVPTGNSAAGAQGKGVAPKAPEVVPMNFYDGITFGGVLHRMRPEFKGRSTLALIKSGDRTATSRRMRPTVAVGDVLAMTNKSGEQVMVRVTKAPYKVSDVTPEQWSKLEGWDTSVYGPYKDAWQYQYELADQVAGAQGKGVAPKPAAPTTLTAKITKQLAGAKTAVDKKNALFDELKTLLDNHTERGAFGVRLTNLNDDVKDVASYLETMSTAEMNLREKLTPAQGKALTEMLTKAYRAFQMTHGKSVVDVVEGIKQSKQAASSQTADDGTGRQLYTEAQIAAAKKFIADRLGDSVEVEFKSNFGDNSSGSWTSTQTKSIIRLALNGDIFGAAAHESMHEFFSILGKAGSTQTQDILLRTAKNPILLRQVERLLDGHPAAVEQIMSDPEEALAFMYQFWNAGLLKLGPQTRTFFQKIKDYIAKVLNRLSSEDLDQIFVDKVFRAFDAGVVSKGSPYTKPALTDGKKRTGPETMEGSVRDAMLRAFEQNAEAHNKALDAADKYGRNLVKNLGKLGFSAEAMMLATKNKNIEKIMRKFNQEAGTAMQTAGGTSNQAFFPGVHQHMGIYMNRLSNILTAYKPEDLELARKAMASDKVPTDRIAKEIAQKIYALNEDLFKYITSRKVMRRDDDLHTWVPVEHRARYFPQVWNTEEIAKDPNEVARLLLERHMKELSAIAAEANKEVANKWKLKKGNVSRDMLDSGDTTGTITEAMIADAIVARMMQSGGHVEHDETTSDLGISPAATSVNRRSLSWIDPEVFDKFKSKDMTSIMTSYISSMVKRAEYTKHFGPGGETLRDDFDRAVVEELGGDKLLTATNRAFATALADYENERLNSVAAGKPFKRKRPSLRDAGIKLHIENVGQAKADADVKEAVGALEQAAKAIMAMEGTLGSDISPATRKVVSAITAYQTVRLLPTVLFSSINDVMGLVAQGGDLKDAWKGLVRGLREVRLRWKDEKSTDTAALRAEEWGTVEAGSHMEVLGQIYGSMYMTGLARKMSNSFFKWNGMEGWNRAMRIEATVVAERALTGLAKHGYDKTDKAAVARVEGLYGENFDTSKIALTPEGRLDTTDAANQAAMMRWVSNAIMTPNAAHRTIWGSDPRMAPFWHLKQFAYTFHRVMLKGAYEQAKLGNYRPAAVLALGYAPVTIAAGAVKELMIPGEEPPWMQGGLDDYLAYGVSRAGIFGIPGMTYSSVSDDYGVNMLGPTVSQVASVPFDEPVKTGLRAMPLGTLLGRMAPSAP